MWPFHTIYQISQNTEIIKRSPYGVIEVEDGELSKIILRPWPKMISIPEIWLFGRWRHGHQSGDKIRIYFNQPLRFRNFLVLKYAESAQNTSYRTLSRAMAVLDEVARCKRSDALLCETTYSRLTAKIMTRGGWTPHCLTRRGHHYIKRFYGTYPATPAWLAQELGGEIAPPELDNENFAQPTMPAIRLYNPDSIPLPTLR